MSYPRNSASPPPLFATVVKAADGTAVTTAVAAKYSTGAGSQAAGGGTCQHEGNGQWSYTPTQAETNVSAFGIQFYHADAVGLGPTISVVTSADVVQTGDVYAVVTHATYGLDKLARTGADSDTLETLSDQLDAVKTETAAILEDTGTTLPAAIADVPTVAEFEARTLPAANYFDPAADTVVNVTTVATVNALGTDAVSAAALAAGAVDEILDEVIEGTITLRQAIRIILARLVNKASGGGTTTLTFRDVADSKPRVTMTVDADGNRSAVTLDGA